MQRTPVVFIHLIHLIHRRDTHIRKDEGARLERPASVAEVVFDGGGCETRGCRGLAARVDSARSQSDDVTQHLGLCNTRVTHEEHMNVASEVGAVGKSLHDTAEEDKRDGFLDFFVAVD